jgi:HPt (histidine-containing phosphotransfer) domain-containing protein
VAPTQAILDDLRRASADADRKAIKDQAHKLKSSSRSIGSTTLADLCAELETRAASDDHDDIGPLVSEVDALANTVIDAIQNDLGSPRAIASGE